MVVLPLMAPPVQQASGFPAKRATALHLNWAMWGLAIRISASKIMDLKTIDYSIVAANRPSEEFLWQALYYAAHMDEEPKIAPESAKANPALMPYVAGWGDRAGDIGFVAVMPNCSPIGAAWLRLMPVDW